MDAFDTRPKIFLDVRIGDREVGRLVVELFVEKMPGTCERFRALCRGDKYSMSYQKTAFHRIDQFVVKGGATQGSKAVELQSTDQDVVVEDALGWKEIDSKGLLCIENSDITAGRTEFFITLFPSPHLHNTHTPFGRLVSDLTILKSIAQVPVTQSNSPAAEILIYRCGELETQPKFKSRPSFLKTLSRTNSNISIQSRGRRKRRRSHIDSPSRSQSPSRGHTRRSGSRHQHHHRKHHRRSSSGSSSPPSDIGGRERRRSDADLDHGLRGRPRKRSRERTRSPILESVEEARRHRRERSPPPSRSKTRVDGRSSEGTLAIRRQRSLPNLYSGDVDDLGKEEDRGKVWGRNGGRGGWIHGGGHREEYQV